MLISEPVQMKTPDEQYLVHSLRIKEPWNIEDQLFKSNNLDFASPAQIGLMRQCPTDNKLFLKYSRTNMGVLFMIEENEIALIKNSHLFDHALTALLATYSSEEEIPLDPILAYVFLKAAQKAGSALVFPRGIKTVPTYKFETNKITNFMFTDKKFNARAQQYGNTLNHIYGINEIVFDFEDESAPMLQSGIYYNKIRMMGNEGNFKVFGRGKPLCREGAAVGVRFEKIYT
ncbi:MAG: hypothetical protein ACP5N2_01840 [Candidatus Nanoarchaeia archaeon]